MEQQQARELARVLGGEVWTSDDGAYLVALRRPDGAIVVFSDDAVTEYADDDAFDAGTPVATILLRDDPTEYWVIEDEEGTVILADPDHGRGWPNEGDAEHEARGIESRTGLATWARPQCLEDTLPMKTA